MMNRPRKIQTITKTMVMASSVTGGEKSPIDYVYGTQVLHRGYYMVLSVHLAVNC